MAVEFGDHTSGFRHTEVIRFINNEVLMNGGGPEFYMTFRSRSWNDIEDQLHSVLVDPKVPRSLKRACTWSALALSVRVAARQREQKARRGRLQDQVGEREIASWTLASELQRLREERDQAAAQLVSTQNALQEAMDEREVLRGRLLQAERSALPDMPEPRVGRLRTANWSLEDEEQEELPCRQPQNMPNVEEQMPISPVLSYLPGLPGSWVQTVHPILRVPVPNPVPLNAQFPLGFPYSTPVPCSVVVDSGAAAAAMAAVVPQMAPSAVYPPGMWISSGSQDAVTSAWGQVFHRPNEFSDIHRDISLLGDNVSHSEQGSEKPCGIPVHRDNNHKESQVVTQVMPATEKKTPTKDQVTAAPEVNSNHNIKEKSAMPQGKDSQGNKTSCTQKSYPGIPRKVVGLKDSISHNTTEDSLTPQETATQANATSPILKRYPGILLRRPDLGSSLSCKQKEHPKTHQETVALEDDNRSWQKENTITFQQMTPRSTGGNPSEKKDHVMPQGIGKSQSQKEEPNRLQASTPVKSKSYSVSKNSKQLSPKQKTKQAQRAKSPEIKQPEKALLHRTPVNWVCPSCKTVNRSWCKGCNKCAKAGAQFGRKDFDPKPTH
ncbi:testis-expressed protein 13C-1 [Cricetulus griseus]|uniref:Testis-expressed sequence 13A protein n=1 Tax=Cricetulus griseus TaxID=10029 RepID=G3HWA1_CRIGR|nr:testis-expressed protein 13C-1 [Cricetulus griseus]EGW10663.1 Testis-expressed sequence 13A protein [Cricetulus griseus]